MSPETPSPDVLVRNCVRFCRLLRDAGLQTTPTAAGDLLRVARSVGLVDKQAFFHASRALLVRDRRDWPAFEAVFHAVWRKPGSSGDLELQRPAGRGLDEPPARLPAGAPGRRRGPFNQSRAAGGAFGARPMTAGAVEQGVAEQQIAASWARIDRAQPLRDISEADVVAALRLAQAAREFTPLRLTRRSGPGPAEVTLDLRRTLRRAAAYQGELGDLAFFDQRRRRRRVVLLCDTSRSMRPFTRAVLGLPYALEGAIEQVETFFFATRLTRVTHLLRRRSPAAVLRGIDAEVNDWGGGTRIGAALADFNRRWARQVATGGAIVVLVSDGLDAGDPDDLAAEAQAVMQRCWRLVWLNPLAGGPGFEPRATGIRALLPVVDVMLPCRDLGSLLDFLQTLSTFRTARTSIPCPSPAVG